MAGALIVPVVDAGLGNSAYLVDRGDGRALAVDAPRHLRAVRAAAARHGLTVVVVMTGGPPDWAEVTGRRLDVA